MSGRDDPLRHPPDLEAELRLLLRQIPTGRATTYGQLARALGDVAASRWVGHYLLHHEHTDDCPCHRVVLAGGRLGSYISGDLREKKARLLLEGVPVHDGAVDLAGCGFGDFHATRPLTRLHKLQDKLVAKLSLKSATQTIRRVAGVDVSYTADSVGVAALVVVEAAGRETAKPAPPLWSTTIQQPVRFPYISSYLAFRELPLLLELLDHAAEAQQVFDVVVIDGAGIMHPRGAGIATHLGVVANIPTIGITKKLLFGRVQTDEGELRPLEPRPVVVDDRQVGAAILPVTGSRRPIYVSPGHLVSVSQAIDVVLLLMRQRRLPEPIYWADRLSRQTARTK